MTQPVSPHVQIDVGDVSQSQLVIGDHNVVQTPRGAKVTVLHVGERPVPKLRELPVARRPALAVEVLGRERELELVAAASAAEPTQVHGPDGIGKTVLLKLAAHGLPLSGDGVVYERVRRLDLDDVQTRLYRAFWDCDVDFVPGPARVDEFLRDRAALILLDDCELDRSDLEALIDSAPASTFVLASDARTLWQAGSAIALRGLDAAAGVRLFERSLGRPLRAEERSDATKLAVELDGRPQAIVEVAALAAGRHEPLRAAATDAALADPAALTEAQRRALAVLAALEQASLGAEHLAAIAEAPAGELAELERLGWTRSQSPRYRLARAVPHELMPPGLAAHTVSHLEQWARTANPLAVVVEAGAIEAAVRLAPGSHRARDALVLALVAGAKMRAAGMLGHSRRVLARALELARTLQDEHAEAYALHELGSLALCGGAHELARAQLTHALQLRESLGDDAGAALTRHNLGQIGGPGGGSNGGPPPQRPPRAWIAIAVAAVLLAAGVAALATAGGGASHPRQAAHTTSARGRVSPLTPAPTVQPSSTPGTPTILIKQPYANARYTADAVPHVSYACRGRVASCDGTVDPGGTVASGAPLPATPGDYVLTVTAADGSGHTTSGNVTYSVLGPPEVMIDQPWDGEAVPHDSSLTAIYSCSSSAGEPEPCARAMVDGVPIQSNGVLDTTTAGPHTLDVKASDKGGSAEDMATYTVAPAKRQSSTTPGQR